MMAYCKDCLHYELCSRTGTTVTFPVDEGVCIPFAYRDRWAEVVRCKDCKHMEIEPSNSGRYCNVWGFYNGAGDDGFCNYGERKDGDGNG